MLMKEEKENYLIPVSDVVYVRSEGVICASGDTDPYEYGEGGGM